MDVELLRQTRAANPFRPFTIHLAEGRSLRVPHRDYLSISPDGRNVIVYRDDGVFSLLEPFLVTEVEVDVLTGQPAGDSGA